MNQFKSQSMFQNYQNFNPWEQISQQSHFSLLRKFNKNLHSYESKYRKQYIDIRKGYLLPHNKLTSKYSLRNSSFQLPLLKQIQNQQKQIEKVQRSIDFKGFIKEQQKLNDSQVFQERTNRYLKLKTISFERQKFKKQKFNRRKFSLHGSQNIHNLSKQMNNQKQNGNTTELEHHSITSRKLKSKSLENKLLRYQINKKGEMPNNEINLHQISLKNSSNQNKLILISKRQKKLFSMKLNQSQKPGLKTNQFSDRRLFQLINNRQKVCR